ncbi:MAG: YncE family protein [Bryobacterales bacterium]|nr:YncE family protein [Bryobacterales bacterium]
MKPNLGVIVLITALGTAFAQAAETPRAALLVLAKTDRTLSIVDPASLKVVARMPSGPDPHEVVASSDGRFAYISNYGGGAYHTLTVVDLLERKTLPAVDLGPLWGPHGLMFAAGKVWFTAEAAKAIGSYDPAAKSVDWIMGTGQDGTHMIHVFEGLQRIATSNIRSGTVTILDRMAPNTRRRGAPGGEWEETHLPTGRGTEGFDVSPNGRELWAAASQEGTIAVIDLETKKTVQIFSGNVKGANRLKFTPDGKRVFVSTLGGPEVVIFDAAERREIKRLKTGRGAAGIQMQPDGKRVYVSCTPDDYVAVVDLRTLEIVGKFEAGKEPDGLAWAVRQ